MASLYDLKIFKLNRIKYEELWQDALTWIKKTYNATSEQFTMASPFAQLLSVILHMSRMIFYYIEDSITGLNIKTAYRPDQIRGLARLSGHNPGRAIAARGAVKITYIDNGNMDLNGEVCFIPNRTQVLCSLTGSTYTLLFGADTAQITMTAGNYLNCTILQGQVKYQSATAKGGRFQTYNFNERNNTDIDEYYINVYVNGVLWDKVNSLLDMSFNQEACMIKTGINGGVDVTFGNGQMGKIPPRGSTIYIEYVVTDGAGGNLPKEVTNTQQLFELKGSGYLRNGIEISLNENFRVTCDTDIIFGNAAEDIFLTQMIAPYASRSFVLANEINYRYFFKRMNMFSTIEILKGYSQKEANYMAHLNYDVYNRKYKLALDEWQEVSQTYGEQSNEAQALYTSVREYLHKRDFAQQQIEDTNLADNTVYLLLIPDIAKRISASSNYFTVDESLFTLSTDEQKNIINLIDNSGQKIITVENKIIQPKTPRFCINVQVKIWEGFNIHSIYSSALSAISNYLIKFKRKDILPLSDITALLEGLEGVDSVKVWFDADVNNETIYCKKGFYGIDNYGDIVLTREYTDINGNIKRVRDILPLIRGGFTSPKGTMYNDIQSFDSLSALNISLIEYTQSGYLALENYTTIT